MLDLAGWLKQHIPHEDSSTASGTGLVHGDFRIDNLVFHPVKVGNLHICSTIAIAFCFIQTNSCIIPSGRKRGYNISIVFHARITRRAFN